MDELKMTLKLIDEIKQHPVLYDSSLPESSQKSEKYAAWCAVAQTMKASVPFVRLKWKSLRSSYARYLRQKHLRMKDGKRYHLAEQLSFLNPHVSPRIRCISWGKNLVEDETSEQVQDENEVDDVADEQILEDEENEEASQHIYSVQMGTSDKPNVIILEASTPHFKGKSGSTLRSNREANEHDEDREEKHIDIPSPLHNSKSSVQHNLNHAVNEHLEHLLVNEKDNPDLLFLRSLLPDMCKLTPAQKSSFKLFIQQKLNNMLYGSSC